MQTDPYAQTGAPLLQVTPMPWGAGWVQSKPYLIDCPLSCIRPADKDSTLVLTATPSAGWTFVGWQVADHGAGPTAGACPGIGTCTMTMSGAKDVVALFDGPTPQPSERRRRSRSSSRRPNRRHTVLHGRAAVPPPSRRRPGNNF